VNVLTCILLATLAGGLLSVCAAFLSTRLLAIRWVPRMVSFAVGVMLATALLDLIPEASAGGLGTAGACTVVLWGLLVFFLLEKLALWRHEHAILSHGAAVKPAGMMVLIGDGVHNFVDGVLIAAAFLQDVNLGIATTAAVIAHEIPQEIGDFLVLLDAGYTRRRALLLNGLCSLTALAGGVLGYFWLTEARALVPYALAFAASGFVYIAIADLVPELRVRPALQGAATQLCLIAMGVVIVAAGHGA
jgi:zinc and cadmium transporter